MFNSHGTSGVEEASFDQGVNDKKGTFVYKKGSFFVIFLKFQKVHQKKFQFSKNAPTQNIGQAKALAKERLSSYTVRNRVVFVIGKVYYRDV